MARTDVIQAVEGAAPIRGVRLVSGASTYSREGEGFRQERLLRDGPDADSTAAAKLDGAVERLNEVARIFNTSLRFVVQPGHEIVVEVIDNQTKEVVRRIPPGQVLEADSKLQSALGVLFDEKA